jgi:hypothetical protein
VVVKVRALRSALREASAWTVRSMSQIPRADFQEWSASSVTVLGPGCLLTTVRKRQIGIV